MNVRDITLAIIEREGGFVNDPDDPGGATKFGVTIHTMRRLGVDMDGDGDVDVRDVKLLTAARAAEIFESHYFVRPRINRLPDPLQATVYDMQVNAGSNAIRILQRLLAEFQCGVSVDGAIGPQTIKATETAFETAGGYLVDAYGIARRNYYFNLADRRPQSRKYARTRSGGKGGWIKRAEEFISRQYHLSNTQFQKRVSAWA